jgi:hypothetical protein
MHTLFAAAIAALLLAIASPTQAADDPATIIDKAIKAHGGADELAKVKAEQWKVKGTMQVMGMKLPYTADYSFQLPGKFRFDVEADIMGMKIAITAITDGKTCWESAMGMTRVMEEKKGEAFLHNVYVMSLSSLLPLKEKECTLAVSGEEKVDGKPAIGVLVSKKGKPDVSLFFDKESGLLVKMQTQIWDEFTNKDVSQEVFFSNYKKKDGRLYFNKMVIKREGKDLLDEELSEQKTSEKLDPKLFEKP